MKNKHASVCLVGAGMVNDNLRLQPWRYLFEVARGLHRHGYGVTIVTDGGRGVERDSLEGIPVFRLPGVRIFPWGRNHHLEAALGEISPSLVLLSVGLTSILHQDYRPWRRWPTIGIFTSPVYTFGELARLGPARLWRGRSLSAIHLLGSLIPRRLLRYRMQRSGLRRLVVQTRTTRDQLLESGMWQGEVDVIPPGVDQVWLNNDSAGISNLRESLGFKPGDIVVAYFGPPAELRGLPALLRALDLARKANPALKLLALSRRRAGEREREAAALGRAISANGQGEYVRLVDGFLSPEELAQHVAACDLAALPFELVPSDAPLGPLEALALGMPLVTTRLACLPELARGGRGYLAEPGDPASLAAALLQAAAELTCAQDRDAPLLRSWSAVGEDWTALVQPLQGFI